jgi:predicted dehydrogenase
MNFFFNITNIDMKTNQTRRDFLATAATGAIAAVVTPAAFAAEQTEFTAPTILQQGAKGANDRIRCAVLGLNGRGGSHVSTIMQLADKEKVVVAAMCDPDLTVVNKAAKSFEEKYNNQKVTVYQDFRKVYDSKDIDAVTLATPNHWHALMTIYACQAGKDVYVEKPATHEIAEGRKMIEAAYKYNRIVQHGVQLRSNPAIREAVQHLRDGLIGRVYMSRGLVFRERPDIGNKGISKVPEGLDYDLWCGPAPMVPFTRNLVHYNWHWHWNYGNGDVGNQGIHETDLCMWGLDVGLPERITSMGGKFLWDDCKEVPEIQSSTYHYPKEKKMIQFEVRNWYTNDEGGATVGNIFYGDKGYLVVKGYTDYESFIYTSRENMPIDTSSGNLPARGGIQPGPKGSFKGEMALHVKNWFDAIRASDMSIQNGPVETGHLSSSLAHLAAISCRLGQQLQFDPVSERFIGNEDANNMLTRVYRAPYLMPEKV